MLEILERIVAGNGKMSDLDELEELAKYGSEHGSVRTWQECTSSCYQYSQNASAMNMRNISAIRNAVQKYVLLFVSSTSTLSSVLAAVNAQRTVRQVRSQVRLNIHITLITTSVSNAVHVRTTVTLMQYMWKHRREDTLWAI